MNDSTPNTNIVITSAIDTLRSQKEPAEKTINQLADEQVPQLFDPETNSIAVTMNQMAGH